MNAQIIHQSKSPLVIEWLQGIHAVRQQRADAMHAVAHDISEKYGQAESGHRNLVVLHWLVGGFAALNDSEPAPTGWLRSATWGGFIPDLSTEEGRAWQQRIDSLPSLQDEFESVSVGMPNSVDVGTPERGGARFRPTFHLNPEQDTAYATWSERQLLQPLNAALAHLDPDSVFAWSEMRRSEWYAFVEGLEADHELNALLGR